MTSTNYFNSLFAFINETEKSNVVFEHSIKIRFLRNFTIEPIEPFLKFNLYQEGIHPCITYSDYNGLNKEILDPSSCLFTEKPDIVVLSLFGYGNDLFSNPQCMLDEVKTILENLFNQLAEKTSALILINTFIPPFYSPLVSLDKEMFFSSQFYIALNYFIRGYVDRHASRFILADWERYLRLYGEAKSIDYRYWYLNKAPFKNDFLNCYAKDVTRIVKVIKGKIKKCLILDCDNTLWGGIIGEDGLDGIKLDDYTYPGKIFYDFQQSVLNHYKQGTIIALCSKNNEEDVWEVLDKHPGCLLKRFHIAAYRINWKDKPTNISELAKELNLGLDSIVFIDDSQVECELIKNIQPDVTVLQVPHDLYSFPQLLLKEHLFDVLSLNEEDKKRALTYQQENMRRELKKKFENVEDYFSDLDLIVDIHYAKESEIPRIAQLTQKTNQFNFNVKRFTEVDIKHFCDSKTSKVFSLSAQDRYGDYGLTGVLIANYFNDMLKIDSMLLSCRILSRSIEYAFIFQCLQLLYHEWGINRCCADFFPTKKNVQVKDFLNTVGFNFKKEEENTYIYELQGMPKIPRIDFIQIKSE